MLIAQELYKNLPEWRKKAMAMDKLVLNIEELANALGISERAARELTHRDGFPRLRMNGIKVPVRELQDWLSKQCEITDTGEAE